MEITLLTGFLALLMSALLLYTFGRWITGVLSAMRLTRQRMLHNSQVSVIVMRGWNASAATMFAPALVFYLIYGLTITMGRHPDPLWAAVIFTVFLICFVLCVLLWLATLYLRLLPKQPYYVYHLPGDANEVRVDNCQKGIIMATQFYPHMPLETTWIDAFVRAMHVSTRIAVFPRGKKDEFQFTNDFSVYCNLAVEAFERGYHGFVALCDSAPDHLEAERELLKKWPQDKDAKALAEQLAQQILRQDEGDQQQAS